MADVDFHALNETIENFENYSTNRKFNVARNTNAYGFEPFMWNSGGTIYQAAAIEKDARFDELSTLGNFGIGTIPDTGWGSKIAMEGQFNASYEKFSISSFGPYVAQMVGDVVMTSESDWKFTKDSLLYQPIMAMLGRGTFALCRGIVGHQNDTFNDSNLVYPMVSGPGNFSITEDNFIVYNSTSIGINIVGGNVGVGMIPTEKFCIKFPEHEIKFYDCIHIAESTPATTTMYLMYKIGTSLYKIPCYGAD
jgi:hypothetical protein